ncbi:FimT Tfp pilus assembly protein FimT [Methylophilaceae bacterium]
MIIIGIMAAMALPRVSALSGYDERGLHDKLKASLQFARKTAVASRRYVCLTVTNGTAGKVSLRFENSVPESTAGNCTAGNNLNPPAPDKTTGCASNEICAGATLSLSSTSTSFRFDPLGRLSPLTDVTFTTTNQPDIVIQAETGNVQ